jgi:hypothetical protein
MPAKGELTINIPEEGWADWKVFRVGQARFYPTEDGKVAIRLILDNEQGFEIGFVKILLEKEIVFGLTTKDSKESV